MESFRELFGILATVQSIFVVFATVFGTLWSRRWLNKWLWKFRSKSVPVICLASSGNINTGRYTRPMTGIGQVQALAQIIPSIQDGYGKHKAPLIFLSTEITPEMLKRDLILIGGAKNNSWTKDVLRDLFDSIEFEFIGDLNTVKYRGKEYHSDSDDGMIQKDWAFVISVPNPYSQGKTRLTILAGLHTTGTHAAAEYLVSHLKGFRTAFIKDYIAVIHVRVVKNTAINFELVSLDKV